MRATIAPCMPWREERTPARGCSFRSSLVVRWLVLTLLLASPAVHAGRSAGERAAVLRALEQAGGALPARGAEADAWQRALRRLHERLASMPLVEGSSIPLCEAHPTRGLVSRLGDWAQGPQDALPTPSAYRAWLKRLRAAIERAQGLGRPSHGRAFLEGARRDMAAILEHPRYSGEPAPGRGGLFRRAAAWVEAHLLRPLFGAEGGTVARGLVVVALLLLAVILGHMAYELRWMLRSGISRQDWEGRLPSRGVVRALSSPQAWLEEGDRARRDGRPLRAVGLYYLALIGYLAEKGCTRFDRTLTNWEHFDRAAGSGKLSAQEAERLRELTHLFDGYCYGGQAPSPAGAERFRSLVLEFRHAT